MSALRSAASSRLSSMGCWRIGAGFNPSLARALQSPARMEPAASGRDPHRQRRITVHEVRQHALGLADHLDLEIEVALQNFFPHDLELQLGQPVADAAMNAKAERNVLARVLAIDDEVVGLLDHVTIPVARDVPHDHLVTGL